MIDYLLGIIIALVFYIFFLSYLQFKERKDLYSKLNQYREAKTEEEPKRIAKSSNFIKNKLMERANIDKR